jgi:hypothetical protein
MEKKNKNNAEFNVIEEEEENFQEDENQRVFANFLRPDGKELILPGV